MWQESKRITRKSLDKGDRWTAHSTQLFPNATFGSSFGAAELFRSRSSLSIECRLFVITSRTRYFIALTLDPMTLFYIAASHFPLFFPGPAKLLRLLLASAIQQHSVLEVGKTEKKVSAFLGLTFLMVVLPGWLGKNWEIVN